MEQKNVKIFYKPDDGGEMKELECVAESDGFEFEPLEKPIDVKYDPTPVTNSFSFDVPVDNEDVKQMPFARFFRPNGVKQYKKIEGKRFRLPRKVKKAYKKSMCKYGLDIKKLKISYKLLNMDVDGNKRKRNV